MGHLGLECNKSHHSSIKHKPLRCPIRLHYLWRQAVQAGGGPMSGHRWAAGLRGGAVCDQQTVYKPGERGYSRNGPK